MSRSGSLRSSERVHDYARELESMRQRAGVAARLRVRAAQRETRDAGGAAGPSRAARARGASRAGRKRSRAASSPRAFDRVRRETARVAALERLAAELAPERTLQRGFSITRTATGALVRDAAQVGSGERVTTELGRGRIESVVERAIAPSTGRASSTGEQS